jgi:hypothetical protein
VITLYCPRKSTGAYLLVQELKRLGHEAQRIVGGPQPRGSLYWGKGGGNKYDELVKLRHAGVLVPDHTKWDPVGVLPEGWLARRFTHMEADDLTAELQVGDFYVRYVPTVREHRVHVFDGESIRVQMKVPRLDNPHPRFRSWANGWKLVAGAEYTAQVPRGAREMAKRAVAAMGYVFGAVDIGVREDGTPIVWEVNSQPGIEGGTVTQYANAVVRYFVKKGA